MDETGDWDVRLAVVPYVVTKSFDADGQELDVAEKILDIEVLVADVPEVAEGDLGFVAVVSVAAVAVGLGSYLDVRPKIDWVKTLAVDDWWNDLGHFETWDGTDLDGFLVANDFPAGLGGLLVGLDDLLVGLDVRFVGSDVRIVDLDVQLVGLGVQFVDLGVRCVGNDDQLFAEDDFLDEMDELLAVTDDRFDDYLVTEELHD